MSVLDSSIAQIIASDGDQRRRKRIDYISQKPPEVRAALLMAIETTTISSDAPRQDALRKLAVGFPQSGFQIDEQIDVKDGAGDPLGEMESRQSAGLAWVPAIGMDPLPIPAGGEPTADSGLIPPGAIIVTTNFDKPASDLVLKAKPFKCTAIHATGPDPFGVGSAYYPLDDPSPELSVWYDTDASKYQKLSVVGYMGATNMLWVKLS